MGGVGAGVGGGGGGGVASTTASAQVKRKDRPPLSPLHGPPCLPRWILSLARGRTSQRHRL